MKQIVAFASTKNQQSSGCEWGAFSNYIRDGMLSRAVNPNSTSSETADRESANSTSPLLHISFSEYRSL